MASQNGADRAARKAYVDRMTARLNENGRLLEAVRNIGQDLEGPAREDLKRRLAALAERERVMRHQLNQLETAGDAAVEDLWNGLAIAWERFACEVDRLKASVAHSSATGRIPTKQEHD